MKLYFKSDKKNFNAIAEYNNDGSITVLKGSKIVDIVLYPKYSKAADQARSDKSIVDENHYVIKDVSFNSLSTAGQFVSGISVNGNRVWKDENNNSIKDIIKKK